MNMHDQGSSSIKSMSPRATSKDVTTSNVVDQHESVLGCQRRLTDVQPAQLELIQDVCSSRGRPDVHPHLEVAPLHST